MMQTTAESEIEQNQTPPICQPENPNLVQALEKERKSKERAIRRAHRRREKARKRAERKLKREKWKKRIEQRAIMKERRRLEAANSAMASLTTGSSTNKKGMAKLNELAASNPIMAKAMKDALENPIGNPIAMAVHGPGKII